MSNLLKPADIVDDRTKQLILLAQNGDTEAFHELVATHDKKIMTLAYQLTQNTQDAEDLYQEVFLKVYRKIKTYKFKSSFYTWLYRVTVNTFINLQRKASNLLIDDIRDMEKHQSGEWYVQNDHIPSDDIMNDISKAVNQLPAKQKTVFILKHFQGLKIKEISGIVGSTDGTVKKYLFRAAGTLKTLLKGLNHA